MTIVGVTGLGGLWALKWRGKLFYVNLLIIPVGARI